LTDGCRTGSGDILTLKRYLSAVRFKNPCDQVKEGGLPRTVRTYQPQYLPPLKMKIELIDGFETAKRFGQTIGFK
jgi:hypothetical protein